MNTTFWTAPTHYRIHSGSIPPAFTPGSQRSFQRVGDAERALVHGVLAQATATGYLDVTEFDTRTDAAMRAKTGAELDRLTADLPTVELRRADPAQRAAAARAAHLSVRIHAISYLATTVLLVAVWALTAPSATWYPWPIWPTLGWGIGVAAHAVPVYLTFGTTRHR